MKPLSNDFISKIYAFQYMETAEINHSMLLASQWTIKNELGNVQINQILFK